MKFLIIGALILAAALFTPIPYYQQYELPCAPCPPAGPCPACPGVGIHFGPSLWQRLTNRPTTYSTTQVNQTSVPSSEDETANWKTYVNSNTGYSFKYPSELKLEEGSDYVAVSNITNADASHYYTLSIHILDNPKLLTTQQYIDSSEINLAGGSRGNPYTSIKEYKNGDLNGLIVVWNNQDDESIEVLQSRKNKIFKIILVAGLGAGETATEEDKTSFNQILSTFTFLDQKASLESNVFSLSDIKVGDKITGMIVKSISPFGSTSGQVTNDAYKIDFTGAVTLSGKYTIIDGTSGIGVKEVDFFPDDSSMNLLPKEKIDTRITWFHLNSYDLAYKSLSPYGMSNNIKIVINNYTINYAATEVSNAADLVQVLPK